MLSLQQLLQLLQLHYYLVDLVSIFLVSTTIAIATTVTTPASVSATLVNTATTIQLGSYCYCCNWTGLIQLQQ